MPRLWLAGDRARPEQANPTKLPKMSPKTLSSPSLIRLIGVNQRRSTPANRLDVNQDRQYNPLLISLARACGLSA